MKPSLCCGQRGAALIIALLILLIMSILAVTSVTTTSMEEKMASNTRQERIAFEAAEAALRSAEAWLAANLTSQTNIRGIFNGNGGMYSEIAGTVSAKASAFNVHDSSQWTTNNSVEVTDIAMIDNANNAMNPRYIIEYIGRFDRRGRGGPLNYNSPDVREFAFRITAIGWGLDTTAQYLLQSTYHMPL
jgi:type IV pilus assembly protein PilX